MGVEGVLVSGQEGDWRLLLSENNLISSKYLCAIPSVQPLVLVISGGLLVRVEFPQPVKR